MVIVYASKTGFTKRYAEMLAAKTALKSYAVSELGKVDPNEDVLFLGWMKAGRIQGLKQARRLKIKAVCASGTGRTAEPSPQEVIQRNQLQGLPFFYLRGGCFPLKEIKGWDRLMLSMFVKILKKRKQKDERIIEAIDIIEQGFDGVKEENLAPVIEWLKTPR